MFIHWGPVSLKGTEIGWSRGAQIPVAEYDQLYKHFNPVKFNADAWVDVAKQAGMKYLIITSKHHDGFCLWPSKVTDFDIGSTPFHRDVLKELSAACRRAGIAFGTYYSVCDWHHPDFPRGSPGGRTRKPHPNLNRYITQYLRKQVAELIQNYGPLIIMEWPDEGALELPAVAAKITVAETLTRGKARVEQTEAGVTVALAAVDRDPVTTVIRLTVDGTALDIPPVSVPYRSDSLAYSKPAEASNVFAKIAQLGPDAAVDDDRQTRWATDSGTSAAWLEVDLGRPTAIGGVLIDEPAEYQRVEAFQLQYLDGKAWMTLDTIRIACQDRCLFLVARGLRVVPEFFEFCANIRMKP